MGGFCLLLSAFLFALPVAATDKSTDPRSIPVGNIMGMIVSADGKSLITLGGDNTVRIWDVASAKEQRKVSLPPKTDRGVLIDSKRVLVHTVEGALFVWDMEREKELVKLQCDKAKRREEPEWPLKQFDVSRDGRSLLTVERNGFQGFFDEPATLYNLETGSVCEGVNRDWTAEGQCEHLVSLARTARGNRLVGTIAVRLPVFGGTGPVYGYQVRCKQSEKDSEIIWETKATNKEKICQDDVCWAVSFTPDDRALLSFNHHEKTTWVSLLESTTGSERCRFRIPVTVSNSFNYSTHPHAFSRNGDLLAVGRSDGATALIDIRLGKEIATLACNQKNVHCVAFGSDDTTLFTAGDNGTVLVWDLREHLRKARQQVELAPADGKRLWAEMADPDTVKAYRAVGTLVTAPAQAVDTLRAELKPIEKKATAAEIDKLVAALDDDEFETRQQASRELRRIGLQGKAALQKSLASGVSLEQRRRIEKLLAELKEREIKLSQEELRELRAVEVLEAVGTPQAWSLLESLARGASGERLTDEAAFALERRDKRVPRSGQKPGE
jgi:WD40 repeat protein